MTRPAPLRSAQTTARAVLALITAPNQIGTTGLGPLVGLAGTGQHPVMAKAFDAQRQDVQKEAS